MPEQVVLLPDDPLFDTYKQIVVLCESFNDAICWNDVSRKNTENAFSDLEKAKKLFFDNFPDKSEKDFEKILNNSEQIYCSLFNVSKGSYYTGKRSFLKKIF